MTDLTATVLERMTTILIEAQTLAHAVEDDPGLATRDREAHLLATSRISAQADAVLGWLLNAPLGEISQ